MRRSILIPVMALTGLAACVDTRLPITDGAITSAEDFNTTVAGNYYATEDFGITIQPNGRYAGTQNGEEFSGSWVFADGKVCLTQTAPAKLPANCQSWSVKGNAFRISGSQGATTYVYRYPLPRSYEQRIGLKS
ncbi:MAG: hypothetical protein OIF40_11930 [Mangrovicoccus sp.]|nr:hypothetical protein [Mangrovicoccus sp.]